jgi:hypothetical protein
MTDDEIIAAVRVQQQLTGRIRPEPASLEQVEEAEQKIGYPLPPLLRRLYLEVANGGFGPHWGVVGVVPNRPSGDDEVITDLWYGDEPNDPLHGLIMIYDWGCAVCSLIDVTDPAGPMYVLDNGRFYSEDMMFRMWIMSWLDGSLEMPGAPHDTDCEDIL